MLAILLTSLFAASGAFAVASIVGDLRRYGAPMLRVRASLREGVQPRNVRFRITRLDVVPAGAAILRPDFRVRLTRPSAVPETRAAA